MLNGRIHWFFRILAWLVMTVITATVGLSFYNWNFQNWLGCLLNVLCLSVPILLYNLTFDVEGKVSFVIGLLCKVWVIIWIFVPFFTTSGFDSLMNGLLLELVVIFILSSIYYIFGDALLQSDKALAFYDIITFVAWIICFGVSFFMKEEFPIMVTVSLIAAFVIVYIIELFSYTKIGSKIFGGICSLFTGRRSHYSGGSTTTTTDNRGTGGALGSRMSTLANRASQTYGLSYDSRVILKVSSWVGLNEIRFTFSGTLEVSNRVHNDSEVEVIKNDLNNIIEEVADSLGSQAESEIENLRENFKGYDKDYSINFRYGDFRTVSR